MDLTEKKLEEYGKNLDIVQGLIGDIMDRMKGRTYSYEKSITDKEGRFSHKKLCAVIEDMLSLWKDDVIKRVGEREDIEDSLTKQYINERLELYRNYLYAVMRLSLIRGGFNEDPGDKYERPDFAFVLEQAKEFAGEYVVFYDKETDEEPGMALFGLDGYFGFHLYPLLTWGSFLSKDSQEGIVRYADMANAGHNKGYMAEFSDFPGDPFLEVLEENSWFNVEVSCGSYPPWSPKAWLNDAVIEPDESLFAAQEAIEEWYDSEEGQAWLNEEAEAIEAREEARNCFKAGIIRNFAYADEYIETCETFRDEFYRTNAWVMRRFYDDIERMTDLYLMEIGAAVLCDVEKSMNIASRLGDAVLGAAKKIADDQAVSAGILAREKETLGAAKKMADNRTADARPLPGESENGI